MRNKLCAANWKLYKNPKETADFLKSFLSQVSIADQKQFLFFIPALNLETTAAVLKGSKAGWGPQNVFYEKSGAFTGENSPQTVFEMGATHVLIGHSERRQFFQETDEWVAKKVQVVQELGMTPVVCVGEILEQRQKGQTKEVIAGQLNQALSKARVDKPLVIAYEPVWAIGTGQVASPEQANEAHGILRAELNRWGKVGAETSILYGGSVKPDNASGLALQGDIDGFLIGGASLQLDSLLGIYKAL